MRIATWCIPLMCMVLFLAGLSAPSAQTRQPLRLQGKEVLPLRVLARPFSHVYIQKDMTQGTVMNNVPAFQPFYVYSRPTAMDIELQDGWYEVGTDNRGGVIGWMQAKDVFEWKQTMCLAFTHPQGREPVLMFEGRAMLDRLVQMPEEERMDEVSQVYSTLRSGDIPADFPVKSVEPEKAVDIAQQFYLLPILDFQTIDLAGREGRLVQLAAVTKAGADARVETDIRSNRQYLAEATSGSTDIPAQVLKQLQVNVVWVMDTTVSMRPFIQTTLEVVKEASQIISQDPEVEASLKFGIWGYRDPVSEIPGIGYTTYNYTPELQSIEDFTQTLEGVEVTPVDSVDFPEDVFSGVDDAMRKTNWDQDALKLIILVGDAPAHELDHAWNMSGQSETTLRAIADDGAFSIFALHVKNPRAHRFHDTAERQFRVLSMNDGMSGESAYWGVSSDDMQGFAQTTSALATVVTQTLKGAKQGLSLTDIQGASVQDPFDQGPVQEGGPDQGGELAALDAPTSSQQLSFETGQDVPAISEARTPEGMIKQMVNAAMVKWVGSKAQAKAPRDVVVWAVDKDLINPAVQSMEVRLLINKRQLDSLQSVLTSVMAAGRRGQIGGEDFFAALQATAATAARDPNLIKNARSMVHTGLVPEFLIGLPYTSQLMDMTNDLWASWSIDEQDQFLNEIEARIMAYQAIHDTPAGWIQLNDGDDPDQYVYPISLDLLP